uniref:Annexin n=1 Tax=Ascaris lumbricoides TaxID=6252 RepID=A0A0M3HJ33_ASCLU
MGTNDRELITIIVQRSEVDLALIRDQYKREFNKKLVELAENSAPTICTCNVLEYF